MTLSSLAVPLLLSFIACYAARRKVDVYAALAHGAEEGLTVLLHILPSLIALLSAVYMFRASGAMEALGAFFARESIVITKHSKKGDKEVDIKPLLHSLEMTARNQNELRLVCVLSAQNPGLNPQLLVSAIETYLPEKKPDFARICRMEVLDDGNTPFR